MDFLDCLKGFWVRAKGPALSSQLVLIIRWWSLDAAWVVNLVRSLLEARVWRETNQKVAILHVSDVLLHVLLRLLMGLLVVDWNEGVLRLGNLATLYRNSQVCELGQEYLRTVPNSK